MAACQRGRAAGALIGAAGQGNVARMLRVLVAAAVVAGTLSPAGADTPTSPSPSPSAPIDYFHQGGGTTINIRRDRSRTGRQKALIYGLAGGAAVFALTGVYFHYDSKRIADDLSADSPQNQRWSPALDDKYDRGQLDGKLAIASYIVSAGLLAATIVVVLKTDPGTEVEAVGTHRTAGIGLVPGGAVVGARWSW